MNKLNQAWSLIVDSQAGFFTNRVVAVFGSVVSAIVILKLTWVGGLTEGYFSSFLMYVVGHASIAKFLDRKFPKE